MILGQEKSMLSSKTQCFKNQTSLLSQKIRRQVETISEI